MKGKDSPTCRKRSPHAGEMVSARRLGGRKHIAGPERDKYCLAGVLLNSFHNREVILQSEKRCDKSELDRSRGMK